MNTDELVKLATNKKISNNQFIGIYFIVCNINKTGYVGQSRNIYTRIMKHKSLLKNNKHENNYLQAVYNKYGLVSFSFYILEECTIDTLTERETYWVNQLDAEYRLNLEKLIIGGKTHSEETKKKLSEHFMGHYVSEETRQKISNAHKGKPGHNKGKKHSEEAKENMSRAQKGRKITDKNILEKMSENKKKWWAKLKEKEPEKYKELCNKTGGSLKRMKETDPEKYANTIENIKEKNRRKVVTEETKQKISKANKGRKHTEEEKEKRKKSNILRYKKTPMSQETKDKISKANKGKKPSKETMEGFQNYIKNYNENKK